MKKKTTKEKTKQEQMNEFFEALLFMQKEKSIPAQDIADKIAAAIIVAAKRDYDGCDVVKCDINVEKRIFRVYLVKTVVDDEFYDDYTEILLPDALKYNPNAKLGDIIEVDLDTMKFGRIVAQTAKHVIRQGIRDAEHGLVLQEFQSKQHEIATAKVIGLNQSGNITLEVGNSEAVLAKNEQVPGEELREGMSIKVYIVDVKSTEKGPKIMISRTHPGLVKRLFEREVPEIHDGVIEIKAIAREAGSRTKIAVYSSDENVDAIGSCIGPKGARVAAIVDDLGGEKMDIVKYSDSIEEFISQALSPAKVVSVEIVDEAAKSCRASVPDNQLSLAIGNKGQNARLAARLTGWKIDIRPESGYYGE